MRFSRLQNVLYIYQNSLGTLSKTAQNVKYSLAKSKDTIKIVFSKLNFYYLFQLFFFFIVFSVLFVPRNHSVVRMYCVERRFGLTMIRRFTSHPVFLDLKLIE